MSNDLGNNIFKVIISILLSLVFIVALDFIEPIGWELFYDAIITSNSHMLVLIIVSIVSLVASVFVTTIIYKVFDKMIIENVYIYSVGSFLFLSALYVLIIDDTEGWFPDYFYYLMPDTRGGARKLMVTPEFWSFAATWLGVKQTISILSKNKMSSTSVD